VLKLKQSESSSLSIVSISGCTLRSPHQARHPTALEQRKNTTPTLAERITKALRIDRPRVGAWGSASAIGNAVEQNVPAQVSRKGTPEAPVR